MLCKPTINNGYNFFLTVVTNFSKDTNELKQNWTLEKTIFWHRFSCPCIRCGLFCSSGNSLFMCQDEDENEDEH